MTLGNSGTYALYAQGQVQNLVPISVLQYLSVFIHGYMIIPSLPCSVPGEQGTQAGADWWDMVGWAHVLRLWKCQRAGENPGFPRWESYCSWNKWMWVLRPTAKDVRPVIDNLGSRELVSRTGIGKRRSQADMSLHFRGIWHTGSIAIELPTEEDSGEATAFTRCFSERGSLRVACRAWPTWQNRLVSWSVADRLPTS